jgi:site-specific recombinase XerD
MPHFYCYTKEEREMMNSNYLSSFIKKAAMDYKKTKCRFFHCRAILRYMVSFGNWLKSNKILVKNVQYGHVNEYLTTMFPHHLGKLSRQKAAARKAVSLILKKFPPKKSVYQRESDRFRDHLCSNRGHSKSNGMAYSKYVEKFLVYSFPCGRICFRSLKPKKVIGFIESIPSTASNSTRRCVCHALRAYFQFLEMYGQITAQLTASIPVISRNRPFLPHRVVDSASLKSLLKSIDRSTKIGKRHYAVILCLVDLALRIGDVANIKLDDINWTEGTILIQGGKTRTPFSMPLPKRLGEAIVDYIKHARPVTKHRELFMQHKKCPDDTVSFGSTLQASVQRIWVASGLSDTFSGTHILRHSTATQLRKKGIPLKIIADFLGHNSIEITKKYAQVDIDSLRQVIQPWPKYGGEK